MIENGKLSFHILTTSTSALGAPTLDVGVSVDAHRRNWDVALVLSIIFIVYFFLPGNSLGEIIDIPAERAGGPTAVKCISVKQHCAERRRNFPCLIS